jgi:hypothetical protein
MSQADILTSQIPFVETEHGRMRRVQRGIDKKDLQRAIKYGERRPSHRRPNGDPTAIYTYNNITYVVNEITYKEVTSYAKPIELECVPVTKKMELDHKLACNRIASGDLTSATSYTVMVVDTSGSMRIGDMWGTRNRLGLYGFR